MIRKNINFVSWILRDKNGKKEEIFKTVKDRDGKSIKK